MASKFQKAIAEIRSKMAVESAQTIARLKQVETDLHTKLDKALVDVHARLAEGFTEFEQALSDQARQNQENLEALLDQLVAMEEEQQTWRQGVDARLARLDEVEARLARLEKRPPAA